MAISNVAITIISRSIIPVTFSGNTPPHKGYGHSRTNQLIFNLKKKPTRCSAPEWKYKIQAIKDVGEAIAANIDLQALGGIVFVPIPPSKPVTSPDYDDRIAQVARKISCNANVREILYTRAERDAAHSSVATRDPVALRTTIGINKELLEPAPRCVVLLDDVLTTGCSFKVCKEIVAEIWLTVDNIIGIFVARRINGLGDRPDGR